MAPGRLWLTLALTAVAVIAATVVYMATPSNSWHLPGQTTTLKTGVENHVNGHVVVVGVDDSGTSATISVDSLGNGTSVTVGDTVRLDWAQRLVVVRVTGPVPRTGGELEVGGTGEVVVRVSLW